MAVGANLAARSPIAQADAESPLAPAVLMEKGIIVGVEHEISYRRSLDFAIFRLITTVSCVRGYSTLLRYQDRSSEIVSLKTSGRRTSSSITSFASTYHTLRSAKPSSLLLTISTSSTLRTPSRYSCMQSWRTRQTRCHPTDRRAFL